MSTTLSQKDFSFKFIPYLPQDAGYKTETHLSSDLMRSSNLTQLNETNDVQRVELLEIMNADLSNLLKMQFKDFIHNISRDDIQKYICTFLQYSRRPTDNIYLQTNDNKGGEGAIDIFGIDELSQSIRHKTFLIIYRLTDSKQSSLTHSKQEYAELLYDKWIFDIPRILDFCSIYYFSNPSCTKRIISYIFDMQPKYDLDLKHAIHLMRQKLDEICLFYHSMDTDLKLSNKKDNNEPKNTLLNIKNDINLMKEILINWYCILQSYETCVIMCVEENILLLMALIIDCTLPIIQEQLNQFQNQRSFNKDNNNENMNKLLHANDANNPSIVIATRLCLLISQVIIHKKYKILYDDLNGLNNNNTQFELLQCEALKLCEFLNEMTNICGFEQLHVSARCFIEVGSYSRKLFGTFDDLCKLINYLLSKNIISLSDIGMISHLIGNISQNIINKHKNEFQQCTTEEKKEDTRKDVTKLLQIFPDHSSQYCSKLLSYFNNKFDVAVNAVLEGTVPLTIEGIDDNEVEITSMDKKKEKKKKKRRKSKGVRMDASLEEYMKFTGRVLKKDDEEEFFDMFGFDSNENSMKKYHKKLSSKRYNMYDDDVDDSNIQYFGFGVDDGGSESDDLEYLETKEKDKIEEEKEANNTLNTQLNTHSYRFIPHNKNSKNNNESMKQNNKKQDNNNKGKKKEQYKAKSLKSRQSNDVRNNQNENENGNEYRPISQPRSQYKPKYEKYNRRDNRRDNRYYDNNQNSNDGDGYGYGDNQRGYNNRSRNNNYNNNNYYGNDGGNYGGYRGRGGGGRGRGRGRGRGGNQNKYRQQRRNATNQYRRNQAHKKYSRVNQ